MSDDAERGLLVGAVGARLQVTPWQWLLVSWWRVLVVAQCKALLGFVHSLTDEQRRELRSWRLIGGRVQPRERRDEHNR
jgi:hypothetical protein